MAVRRDAAAELAGKLVPALEAQRRLGADSYPLTLRRLAELTDHAAPADLVLKAARRKPFSDRAVVARPRDLASPVALAEDAEALADSPLLLVYLLGLVCTPAKPACDSARLKTKLPPSLRPPFEAAVRRRVAEGRLPAGVAVVADKQKQLLHLTRYPLPRPPHVALAAAMVSALRAARERGGDAYPLPLDRLLEMTGLAADAKLVKKALAEPTFQRSVLVAVKNDPQSPVAFAEDRDLLAGSPLLLRTALRRMRTDENHVGSLTDLTRQVVPALRGPMCSAVGRRIEARNLPPGVGCLRAKAKGYLLFHTADVLTGRPPAQPAPPETFLAQFEEAFQQLDRQAGSHNSVSLVDLRRRLPFDRPAFDAGLTELRRAGRYTLSAAEGRHGVRPEERDAGIIEDGTLLLYVSRKRP